MSDIRMLRSCLTGALLLQCLLVGAAGAQPQKCDAVDFAVTTTPAPPPTVRSYRRHLELIAAAERPPPPGIVMIGDSITQAWPDELTQSLFPRERVQNLGIGGDRTQHVIWRLADSRFSNIRPRMVVVLIGTLNLGAGDRPCAIIRGVDKIVERLDDLWVPTRIYLIEILPRGPQFKAFEAERNAVSEGMKLLAQRKNNVSVFDIANAISCNQVDPCQNFLSDRLHLSRTGYGVLTDVLKAKIGP